MLRSTTICSIYQNTILSCYEVKQNCPIYQTPFLPCYGVIQSVQFTKSNPSIFRSNTKLSNLPKSNSTMLQSITICSIYQNPILPCYEVIQNCPIYQNPILPCYEKVQNFAIYQNPILPCYGVIQFVQSTKIQFYHATK